MQPKSQQVPGANGLTLRLLEWSQAGVPLIMLHGGGQESSIWSEFAPSVAPFYRTLALDLRGHGESDWDAECRYSWDYHLLDLESVTQTLGIDRFVLIGHSLGGRTAMLFASQHPERLAGLVIVDIGPEIDERGLSRIRGEMASRDEVSFESVARFERVLARAYPAASVSTRQRMAKAMVKKREDGRFVFRADPNMNRWAKEQPDQTAEEREQATRKKLWGALEKTTCPTLVVRGAASDIFSQDIAERMVETLNDGKLAVVPQASHSVMVDNPTGFQEAVASFVLAEHQEPSR